MDATEDIAERAVVSSDDVLEERLQAALAFMRRECRQNPFLPEIAKVAFFSPWHFHRLFKRRFGKTPKQALMEIRIADVQQLMLSGLRPADAAREASFSTPSHMSLCFKQMTRMTPGRWLAQQKQACCSSPSRIDDDEPSAGDSATALGCCN